MNKIKNIITTVLFAVLIFSVSAVCILKPQGEYSPGERRALAKMPELSAETLLSGEFTDGFESYSTDQFPMREKLRTVKALFATGVLGKLDNNGLFASQGHISKLDEKQNEDMMDYAANKFLEIKNKYLKNDNIYFAIVPDKNFILAPEGGYPGLDYDAFIEGMKSRTQYMKYIDVKSMLSLDDYYKTDSHWKQENITPVIQKLALAMGFEAKPADYYTAEKIADFEGVYAPRLAMKSGFEDEITILNSSATDNATVFNLETGKTTVGVYDKSKLDGNDRYDVYLQGAAALLTVENPLATDKKELVIFRDSFGSSLAPLMLESYSKITIVDLRYVSSAILGQYVDFTDCDVLFIYNTQILNQSSLLK